MFVKTKYKDSYERNVVFGKNTKFYSISFFFLCVFLILEYLVFGLFSKSLSKADNMILESFVILGFSVFTFFLVIFLITLTLYIYNKVRSSQRITLIKFHDKERFVNLLYWYSMHYKKGPVHTILFSMKNGRIEITLITGNTPFCFELYRGKYIEYEILQSLLGRWGSNFLEEADSIIIPIKAEPISNHQKILIRKELGIHTDYFLSDRELKTMPGEKLLEYLSPQYTKFAKG